MFLFINKFSKGLLSILLLIFSYHYFLLGKASISILINTPIEKKAIIPIRSLDIEKEIVIKEKDDVDESIKKLESMDEIIVDQSEIIEETQQEINTKIITIKVKKGDTFNLILNNQKINKKYIQEIIMKIENTLIKYFNSFNLYQIIDLTMKHKSLYLSLIEGEDDTIPENMHKVFSNFIYIHNLFYKQVIQYYNYLSTIKQELEKKFKYLM